MITDIDCFPALKNFRFEFIAMDDKNPSMMVVRKHWRKEGEMCSSLPGLLNIRDVDIDILKRYGIWDKVSPGVQKEIENLTLEQKQAVHNLLEKARAGRKKKYLNVPRELTCTKCQGKVIIPPGILVKKVEKIAAEKGILYTLEDYLKTFECTTCRPVKRGRKANPAHANLPKELVCTCGHKVKTNATLLIQAAARKKITTEELIKGYVCQKCNPTKGLHLKGKGRKKNV